ncbi:MAG: transporter substrate-binding domain-containing protein [Methanobacteriota archaeon]
MNQKSGWLETFCFILIGLFILFSGCTTKEMSKPSDIIPVKFEGSSHLELYTEEQPPMSYIDQQGRVSGRSTEIVRELMKRLEIDAPIHLGEWSAGYNPVLSTPGTAIFSTTLTHQRDPMFKWVGPIADVEYSFFGRDDYTIPIHSLADVKKAGIIAVVGNTGRHQSLQSGNITNLLLCYDDKECVEAVLTGKAALWFGTKDMYAQNAKQLGPEMNRIIEVWPYMTRGMYIAFNRKTPDTEIKIWQEALDGMKADGTYDMILERFMPYICSWVKCAP